MKRQDNKRIKKIKTQTGCPIKTKYIKEVPVGVKGRVPWLGIGFWLDREAGSANWGFESLRESCGIETGKVEANGRARTCFSHG